MSVNADVLRCWSGQSEAASKRDYYEFVAAFADLTPSERESFTRHCKNLTHQLGEMRRADIMCEHGNTVPDPDCGCGI